MSSKSTFRLLFYVNKSKTNKEGAPIMLRITMNGEQASMNVRRRIPLEDWDSKCFMPKVYNAFFHVFSSFHNYFLFTYNLSIIF